MNEILETYTMTPEEEIKWLRQCVRELQQENETNKTIIEKQVKRIYELEQEKEELKNWLEEQEQKAWDEVSSTFGYVSDNIKELEEGVKDVNITN